MLIYTHVDTLVPICIYIIAPKYVQVKAEEVLESQ